MPTPTIPRVIFAILFATAVVSCLYSVLYHIRTANINEKIFDLHVSDSPHLNVTRRVFLFGIDGIGLLPKTFPTPTISKLSSRAFVSWNVEAMSPTLSVECWTSMLHGVPPNIHGRFTFGNRDGPFPAFTNHPSVHKVLSDRGLKSSAISNWWRIENNIIEDNIPLCRKRTIPDDDSFTKEFKLIVDDGTTSFVFMQIDLCDAIGHKHGYFTKEHEQALQHVDAFIGNLIEYVRAMDGENYIIITTDHGGGGEDPKMHGSNAPRDREVFLILDGPGITKSEEVSAFTILDIPSIVLRLLGIEQPPGWKGSVPKAIEQMISSL